MGKHGPMIHAVLTSLHSALLRLKKNYTAQKSHHFKHVITQHRHTSVTAIPRKWPIPLPPCQETVQHTFKPPIYINSKRYTGVGQRHKEREPTTQQCGNTVEAGGAHPAHWFQLDRVMTDSFHPPPPGPLPQPQTLPQPAAAPLWRGSQLFTNLKPADRMSLRCESSFTDVSHGNREESMQGILKIYISRKTEGTCLVTRVKSKGSRKRKTANGKDRTEKHGKG